MALAAAATLLLLGPGVAVCPAASPAATASSPMPAPHHNGATLVCADCHVAAAGAGSASAGAGTAVSSLKYGDVNDLCLSCHDGVRGIPDVVGVDVNMLLERSAGLFEPAGLPNARGHDLGPRMTCISCHDPHGNGNARNLRIGSAESTPLGMFERPGVDGLARYEKENIAYGTLDSPTLREVSALCVDCHRELSGSKTSRVGPHGGALLHPTYDSAEGFLPMISSGGHATDPEYWNAGSGPEFDGIGRVPFVTAGASDFPAASTVDAGRNGVFCLTCHDAHGSTHTYALRWEQRGTEGAAGCNQCHAMQRRRLRNDLTQSVSR